MALKCNRDNMLKWIAALESGDYLQTDGVLERREVADGSVGHCCLGVATRVAMKEGVPVTEKRLEGEYKTWFTDVVDGAEWNTFTELPPAVVDWLGIDDDNPIVGFSDDYLGDEIHAIEANDEKSWSFDQIAASLRKTYLEEEAA